MKNKLRKTISILLCILTLLSAFPVLAASTGSVATDESIGEDVVQGAKTEYSEVGIGGASTDTYLTVDDENVLVKVPTTVILNGEGDALGNYVGEYSVQVSGDIAGNEALVVQPKADTVSLSQEGKENKDATITQNKTVFTYEDLQNNEITEGKISANGLTAGSWNGSGTFDIQITSKMQYYSSVELAATDANALNYDNADCKTAQDEKAVAALYVDEDDSQATIRLLKDVSEVQNFTLENNTVLDLDNHLLSFADNSYVNSIANLHIYDGEISGNNSPYVVYENSQISSLSLSNLNITLDSNVNENSFVVYSKGISNSLNHTTINVTNNNTSTAIGAFVLSETENSTNNVTNCNFTGKSSAGEVRLVQSKGTTDIENTSFNANSESGQIKCIYNYGSVTIKDCEFYASSGGTIINLYCEGNDVAVLDSTFKCEGDGKGSVPIYINNADDVDISNLTINAHDVNTAQAIYINNGNVEINDVDINVSISESTGSGAVGINVRGGETNLYQANIVSTGPKAMGLTCANTGVFNIIPKNSEDIYVYGEGWGISTRATSKNALTIKGGTYISTNHIAYIGSSANIENAVFYSEDNGGNGGFYFGSENCPVDAVVNIRNCVIGTPDKAPCYNHCFVSQTGYGYQDVAEVNIYDCDVYQGTVSTFSYHGKNNNQTKFNIYGDTHFYKPSTDGSSIWTEYSKSEINDLLSDWKNIAFSSTTAGNKFVISNGNATIEDGKVVSIPLQETANVYDYR